MIKLAVSLAMSHGLPDYIGADAERPPSIKPTKPLGLSFATRSRPALQINPKNATLYYLEIDMPPADIRMIENHVSP